MLAAGDKYVDWVGTSVYHFGGSQEPFIYNQQPAPFAFNYQVGHHPFASLALQQLQLAETLSTDVC